MIIGWLHARAERRRIRTEAIILTADHLIRFNAGDLHRAFWSAHDRFEGRDRASSDRGFWRDVLAEIDRRRPPRSPRADTATRMVFRHPGL